MKKINVPIHYGLIETPPYWRKFQEAQYSSFPNSRDHFSGGCVVEEEEEAIVFQCPQCVALRETWLSDHPPPPESDYDWQSWCWPSKAYVDVAWETMGVLHIEGQNHRLKTVEVRIDLVSDLNGCLGELYDSYTGETAGDYGGNGRILDASSMDGFTYVLAMFGARPNCNVQGRCGAGDDNVTLFWLMLDRDLTVIAKQVVQLTDCRESRLVLWEPADDEDYSEWFDKLEFNFDDELTLNIEDNIFDDETDELTEVHTQVSYNRQMPDQGIKVMTLNTKQPFN